MTRLRRVSLSRATKEGIIVSYNTKGQPVDPNTWEPLVKGQTDNGHKYEFEERVMRKAAERVNMSQADYNKMMNDPSYSEQVHAAFKTIRRFYNKQRSAARDAAIETQLRTKYVRPHFKSTVKQTDGRQSIIGYSTAYPAHRSNNGTRSLSEIAASHKSIAASHGKSSGSPLSLGSVAASHQVGSSGHTVGGSSGGHSSSGGRGGKASGHGHGR